MRWREEATGTGCRACGVCCDLYGHTLRAGADDLERWRLQGRNDVLCRVGPGGELWWAADGSARLDHCPFFSWRGADGGACSVHDTKPAECRAYPTALHGHRCVMGAQFPRGNGRERAVQEDGL
ncbi:MAG TPA: YkgJ family cysteine cluster protein [Deferrisomatales bacterium]|nr:YkgJ family cysteine cluster protein [Deferrisomatales bacterium]